MARCLRGIRLLRMGQSLLSGNLRYYPRYEGSAPPRGPPVRLARLGLRSSRVPRYDRTIVGCDGNRNRRGGVLGMKLNTPLVTLLSGAALGVGVLVTSMLWTSST